MSNSKKLKDSGHINKLQEILKKRDGASNAQQQADDSSQSSELEALHKDNQQLNEQVSKLKRNLLVALADKENLRKSMLKEKEAAQDYAITRFAEEIVASLDSLEDVLGCIGGSESTESSITENNANNIVDGIKMTAHNILNVLKNHGIEKIAPLGEKFDHNYHQAVQLVDNQVDEKSGIVKEVLKCGYVIKDRLLRAAVVKVFK